MEQIYAIASGPQDSPTFHYVGMTSRTVEQRFAEHVRAARNPLARSCICTLMRETGVQHFWVLTLDSTDSGICEADYVKLLRSDGHPLQNVLDGNTKVCKPRSFLFRDINRAADQRLRASSQDFASV